MELFWKTSGCILVTLILVLTLGKQQQDMGTLLAIAVCCMTGIAAIQFLDPVQDFIYELQSLTFVDLSVLKTLFKLVGIGLVAELIALICYDAGCASLGKSLQLLASSVVLYMSTPIIQSLIDLICEIMGGL